jgi:hypothetical protein
MPPAIAPWLQRAVPAPVNGLLAGIPTAARHAQHLALQGIAALRDRVVDLATTHAGEVAASVADADVEQTVVAHAHVTRVVDAAVVDDLVEEDLLGRGVDGVPDHREP